MRQLQEMQFFKMHVRKRESREALLALSELTDFNTALIIIPSCLAKVTVSRNIIFLVSRPVRAYPQSGVASSHWYYSLWIGSNWTNDKELDVFWRTVSHFCLWKTVRHSSNCDKKQKYQVKLTLPLHPGNRNVHCDICKWNRAQKPGAVTWRRHQRLARPLPSSIKQYCHFTVGRKVGSAWTYWAQLNHQETALLTNFCSLLLIPQSRWKQWSYHLANVTSILSNFSTPHICRHFFQSPCPLYISLHLTPSRRRSEEREKSAADSGHFSIWTRVPAAASFLGQDELLWPKPPWSFAWSLAKSRKWVNGTPWMRTCSSGNSNGIVSATILDALS